MYCGAAFIFHYSFFSIKKGEKCNCLKEKYYFCPTLIGHQCLTAAYFLCQ